MRSGLCREVFGPEGRLIEIQSAEDQELAVQVMKAAGGIFPPELSWWWSALRYDGLWVWTGSNTPLNWHPDDWNPDLQWTAGNCMQFLYGTTSEGERRKPSLVKS